MPFYLFILGKTIAAGGEKKKQAYSVQRAK